jgi:iron complex outermembrane receptor protein
MSPGISRALLATAAVAGLMAGAGTARAQTDQPTASRGGNDLEEIVVTARRKEERVQTVPIAITAFSQADLEKQHIENVQDLARTVPSLAVSNSQSDANAPYSGQTRLRGLAGSVVYFADVPLGSVDYQAGTGLTHGLSNGFYYDLDNLEVLKGPQGTLFGKNSIGGLISIEPKKPTNEFEGYVQATFGNYNDRQFEGAVNIPIVQDKLLIRIAGQSQQRDGYTKDVISGQEYDNRDYYSWRVGVTLRPTDDLEDYFLYDGYYQDSNGSSAIARFVNPNFAVAAISIPGINAKFGGTVPLTLGAGPGLAALENPATAGTTYGQLLAANAAGKEATLSFFPNIQQVVNEQAALGARDELGRSVQGIGKDYFYGFTNTTTWDVADNLTVKNVAAARIFKQLSTTDDFGTYLPALNVGVPGNQQQWGDNSIQYTEELQLQGKALNDKLSWVLGGFLEYDGPLGDTLLGSTALGAPSFYHFTETARSQAAFAHGIYDLSDYVDGLRFTAGYRYTWDHVTSEERGLKNVDVIQRDATGAPTNCATTTYDNNCHISEGGSFSSFGWNVGLDEQLTPTTLLYVRSGNAYRPGGFNLNVGEEFAKFQPEHVTDVEIGAKVDWDLWGIHGRTNADLYHTDYKSIQVQELVSVPGVNGNPPTVNSAYQNAATATLEGGELEASVEPVTGLVIEPRASYIYSHFDQYPVGFGTLNDDPAFQYLPKWQYSVTATYTLPVDESWGDISVSGTYSWTGHEYLSVNVGEIYPIMPSYENINLRVDWKNIFGNTVDAAFFMTNVTDNTHVIGGFPIYAQLGFTSLVYNEPRMFGFTVKYRFGGEPEPEAAPAAYTPPPVVAPAPSVPKSYLVFFDFNKSDLTPQAVSIVNQAAANAGPAHVTQLTVTGHTDTVGSDAYNMRLSRRRAESVAAQLEKDGIASSEIEIVAKGKRDLLVPTADGVKEPQNRRVQIVYSGGPTS